AAVLDVGGVSFHARVTLAPEDQRRQPRPIEIAQQGLDLCETLMRASASSGGSSLFSSRTFTAMRTRRFGYRKNACCSPPPLLRSSASVFCVRSGPSRASSR